MRTGVLGVCGVFVLVVVGVVFEGYGQESIFGGAETQPAEKLGVLGVEECRALLKKAEAWGMVMPERGWRLGVMGEFDREGKFEEGRNYWAGFEVPKTRTVLVGYSRIEMKNYQQFKVLTAKELLKADLSANDWGISRVDGVNLLLAAGLQELKMGDEKLGVELINRARELEVGHAHGGFYSRRGEGAMLTVARTCLAGQVNEMVSETPDHARIKGFVEQMVADVPELKGDTTKWLLEGLAENVAYKKGGKGSVEAVIDDYLMDMDRDGMPPENELFTPRKKALVMLGFDAVPALMAQRNSKRFTNHVKRGFNNFPSYPMRARAVISEYIVDLANDELGGDWLKRQRGAVTEEDVLKAWWEKAREMGEKGYVEKYGVVIEGGEGRLGLELFVLAEKKYPELLPGMYEKLMTTSDSGGLVLQAIGRAKGISEAEKMKWINVGLASKQPEQAYAALSVLVEFKPEAGAARLVEFIKNAPSTAEKEYWSDPSGRLSWLATASNDVEVWREFEGWVGRADLGMRLELLSRNKPRRNAPEEVLKVVDRIYDRYALDETVRDREASEKFKGPCNGFGYKRISVRNLLRLQWAWILKVDAEEPKEGASVEEWKVFGEAVDEAVKRYRETRRLPDFEVKS